LFQVWHREQNTLNRKSSRSTLDGYTIAQVVNVARPSVKQERQSMQAVRKDQNHKARPKEVRRSKRRGLFGKRGRLPDQGQENNADARIENG